MRIKLIKPIMKTLDKIGKTLFEVFLISPIVLFYLSFTLCIIFAIFTAWTYNINTFIVFLFGAIIFSILFLLEYRYNELRKTKLLVKFRMTMPKKWIIKNNDVMEVDN